MEMNVIQKIFSGYESVIVIDSRRQCCTNSTNTFIENFLGNLSKVDVIPDKINDNNCAKRYFVGINDYVDNDIIEKAATNLLNSPDAYGKIRINIYHPSVA